MPISVNLTYNNPQVRSKFDARCIGQNLDPLDSAAYGPKPKPVLIGWLLLRKTSRSSILNRMQRHRKRAVLAVSYIVRPTERTNIVRLRDALQNQTFCAQNWPGVALAEVQRLSGGTVRSLANGATHLAVGVFRNVSTAPARERPLPPLSVDVASA